MGKVIGCDLGTTNSVIAIKQADVKVLQSRENQDSIPSVVGSHKDQIIVGSLAVGTPRGTRMGLDTPFVGSPPPWPSAGFGASTSGSSPTPHPWRCRPTSASAPCAGASSR